MKCENVKSFCEKFNDVISKTDASDEEVMWLNLWETMYAISIIKDVGNLQVARRIGDRLITICEEY